MASSNGGSIHPTTSASEEITTGRERPRGGESQTDAAAVPPAPNLRKCRVGLANQGATCYLNSLLQALFWTPELRRVLFHWRPTTGEETTDSIPFQLQVRKFLKLYVVL